MHTKAHVHVNAGERERHFVILANGDWSGDITINEVFSDNAFSVLKLPVEVFIAVAAEMVRDYRTERLENLTPRQLVGLPEEGEEWAHG